MFAIRRREANMDGQDRQDEKRVRPRALRVHEERRGTGDGECSVAMASRGGP
jgi:hypothetical protein